MNTKCTVNKYMRPRIKGVERSQKGTHANLDPSIALFAHVPLVRFNSIHTCTPFIRASPSSAHLARLASLTMQTSALLASLTKEKHSARLARY
jgi:hypothetical protein